MADESETPTSTCTSVHEQPINRHKCLRSPAPLHLLPNQTASLSQSDIPLVYIDPPAPGLIRKYITFRKYWHWKSNTIQHFYPTVTLQENLKSLQVHLCSVELSSEGGELNSVFYPSTAKLLCFPSDVFLVS